MPPAPLVAAGEVRVYRFFDIAYAVDLDRAEAILARRPGAGGARKRLSATPPKAVAYEAPPVVLSLDPVPLVLDGAVTEAAVSGRLFDFGVLRLAITVPVADMPWDDFVRLANRLATEWGASGDRAQWQRLAHGVTDELAAALERPAAAMLDEDYVIALVRSFDRRMTASEITNAVDLVPLLSGEHMPLADDARQDLLRNRFSYYADDLVVLTWDRAFVVEPRGDSDVVDVLEVANAQLLEMRYYDELLDDELPRMYGLVQSTRGGGLLASRRFAGLARRLYTLVAEVTELTEKVENALQVTEDVYLARVYTATLDLFRVRLFSLAVDRKLAIIRDTYTALYDEAAARRSTLLEVAIVLLFVIEIGLAVWH